MKNKNQTFGIMDRMLETYFKVKEEEKKRGVNSSKTLIVPWIEHGGKSLDREIEEYIDHTNCGSSYSRKNSEV